MTTHDPALVERVWRVLLDRTRQQADQDAARAVLDDITETHAVVELPKSPSEYWGRDHQPQWNHYPFTRVDGDEVEIGARSEHVFRVNAAEALTFAADLLAAANAAESGSTTVELTGEVGPIRCCPNGCDCSCCYGYPDKDCHCFTYPCNCGGGPTDHGRAESGSTTPENE